MLVIHNSAFESNRAAIGGAVVFASDAPMPATYFPPSDAGVGILASSFVNNIAIAPPGGGSAATAFGGRPCLPGGGGAFCLRPKGSPLCNITKSLIAGNSAALGGALHTT
jgi:hypothetical protein